MYTSFFGALRLIAIFCLAVFWASGVPAQSTSGIATATAKAADPTATPLSPETERLIGVLEDASARTKLIAALKSLEGVDTATTDPDGAAPTTASDTSVGRKVADTTKTWAEDLVHDAALTWKRMLRSAASIGALGSLNAGVIWDTVRDLFLVIASTVAVFLVLRGMAKSFYARLGRRAAESDLMRSVGLFWAMATIDILIVIFAWMVGYALALLAFGDLGEIGIRQTLYLNAFLVVELIKVMVRMLFSPSAQSLRLLPLSDWAARYTSRRLNLIVGLVGYGELLVVPIVNANLGFAAGRAVTLVMALVVLALAVYLATRNRRAVASWLLGQDEDTAPKGALRVLVRNWHWPVLAYLAGVFIIVMTRPTRVVFETMINSAQVALVVVIGVVLSGALTGTVRNGVRLPQSLNHRLPLLQRRLNGFVPRILSGLRMVIFIFVVLFALNALGVLDLRAMMASQIGLNATATLISVALILAVSCGIWLALTSWVDYRLNPDWGSVPSIREKTLLSLLRNAATIALAIVTAMFVLAKIGLDIAPLLASAGVLGLAIGFGAQKMVQDIITGIFIQFEGVINVGDVISLNGTTGTVEKLTIRSVSLRDVQGVFHMIPFSSVDMVSNYMKDYGYFVCDMGVAYRESVAEVREAMFDAFTQLKQDAQYAPAIIGDLEWFGLNAFGDSAIVLRSRIKTIPGQQWGVGRAYNEIVKALFDARGIEIPYPYQTLTFAESKDGKTQPLRVESANTVAEKTAETSPETGDSVAHAPRADDVPGETL